RPAARRRAVAAARGAPQGGALRARATLIPRLLHGRQRLKKVSDTFFRHLFPEIGARHRFSRGGYPALPRKTVPAPRKKVSDTFFGGDNDRPVQLAAHPSDALKSRLQDGERGEP